MQAKREYIILILVIAALSLYLFMKKADKTHYSLPELSPLAQEEITRLTINKKDSQLLLEQENDRWLIHPQKYPADSAMITKMLETLADLTLTAMVSESENYLIFDLDEENRISVEAFQGENLARRLDIGKAAPSNRHTFVKLADDSRVYHAAESFRDRFDKEISALRDKQVMKIEDQEAVSELILMSEKDSIHILRATIPPAVDLNQEGDEQGEEAPPAEPPAKWQTAEGEAVKEEPIDTLITTLSDLKCDQYVEDGKKEDYTEPTLTVSLKGVQDYEFSLYQKEDNKYPATSSGNEYPFLIPEWRAKKINLEISELVETSEDTTEE